VTTFEEHDGGLWVPQDAVARVEKEAPNVVIDNQTDVPDQMILDYFEENTASFGWGQGTRFQTYQAQGSMLGRAQNYRPPSNVIEEISLARDLAERDDDVAPALNGLISTALADGFQNQHPDEQVEHTFDKLTEDMGLRAALAEMMREWLIAGSVTTSSLFIRASYDIRPEGVSRVLNRSVASPRLGILPAEQVRVVGNDLFGMGELAFIPQGRLAQFLREYFSDSITAAKRRELQKQDPVAAALFTRKIKPSELDDDDTLGFGDGIYALNPTMVARSTMPKGMWKYPRPPLTRNLPLIEAKRLLNVMDHALLQGGTNYIIVVKKGSDARPALQPEVDALRETVKRAARQGVLVGDHRLSLDIVTPDLKHLLDPDKRRMIGRKLALGLLRIPEFGSDETGQSISTFTELLQKVITHDRNELRDHIHAHVWNKTMERNANVFGRTDRPTIWFPKLILTGFQFFSDYLLKMYDRGDLPRRYMVEFGGFEYDAVKAQKEREVDAGHDDIFQPPAVPFSSPANGPGGSPGPQDNGGGRPPGSGPNNGAPHSSPSPSNTPARPRRVVRRTRGETVRAVWDENEGSVLRIGDLTQRLLDAFPDASIGRMTAPEQRAIEASSTAEEGTLIFVPVSATDMTDHRIVRLTDDFSVVTGCRDPDGAILARTLIFRRSGYTLSEAENEAIRHGFEVEIPADDGGAPACPECGGVVSPTDTTSPTSGASLSHPPGPDLPPERRRHHHQADDRPVEPIEVHVHMPDGGEQVAMRTIVERDPETNAIVGTRQERIEPAPAGGE
jgi:hypothetical protein